MPRLPDVAVLFDGPAGAAKYVAQLAEAVRVRLEPDGWRPSEYAVTKAHAGEALKDLARQVAAGAAGLVLEYFTWTVIQGELARLALVNLRSAAGVDHPAVRAYLDCRDRLRRAADEDKRVGPLLKAVELAEGARRELEAAERRVGRARRAAENAQAKVNTLHAAVLRQIPVAANQ